VANGVAPERLSAVEAAELEALGAAPDSPVGAALWAHARARAQRAQLRRLRAGLDAPPVRLPFVFGEPRATELAARLERAL
jgi:hypothetical protein